MRSLGTGAVNGQPHEYGRFARFVEFRPADVEKQIERCPFHKHCLQVTKLICNP